MYHDDRTQRNYSRDRRYDGRYDRHDRYEGHRDNRYDGRYERRYDRDRDDRYRSDYRYLFLFCSPSSQMHLLADPITNGVIIDAVAAAMWP